MTFEEWCDSKSKAGFQSDTKQFMELAWNAAIEAALVILKEEAPLAGQERHWSWSEAYDSAESLIERLKTK